MSEGNIEFFFFLAAVVQRSAMTTDEALIKSSYGSVYYTYISGLMLWLHRCQFMDVKRVKIPSLPAFQLYKYMIAVK